MSDVERLFDEYAAAFTRGERPDVRMYLDLAGGGREELGLLIDAFLQAAPAPPPSDEALRMVGARLVVCAARGGVRRPRPARREEVVDELLRTQGWPESQREKVKTYYHQLESGLLDARRVALPVLEAVARFLGVHVADFEGYRAPPTPAGVYARVVDQEALPPASAPEIPEEDEIDRAFHSGR